MSKKRNKQILTEVSNRKGDVADAIGMPDEQDYQVLSRIIKRFEATNPGLINYTLREGRKDYESGVYSKNKIWKNDAVVNRQANMVYSFELPAGLYSAIEKVFPSMFKSKKHLAWFKRNFYKLTIANQEKK